MPSKIVRLARQRNAAMRAYQEIATNRKIRAIDRLKAADRLAVITGLLDVEKHKVTLGDPEPSQIMIPEEDIQGTVDRMLKKAESMAREEKEESPYADTLHQTARS